ncbi:PfkB family carbohydrate kinase [Acuticoccus mangrovi]|uniref:pyridoxal kinase n=1 Tax=Acuticoccus mangrovi TaxID=2796142 RepID=A0A934ILF5_9HYPH|nr:PfkB family carbohydrate kinase [Acuticoccus mangrovi]MBJ3775982.1 bifunctional hydroxymethylpyrimidine kinase/phosphomethylpyrimidine kinase [Acuticoccus mangrovi]
MSAKTVVAISSFVMRGVVGLRAITFALERRGARVWPVATVTMPWHPGLGPSTRSRPADFATHLDELATKAAEVDAVLTGYFASADQVAAAARFIDAVRAARSDALVLVDPVTGDERGRYVPDAVADAIGSALLPRADIATPNANELRDLARASEAEDDLAAVARRLGPPEVVVTSGVERPGAIGAMLVTPTATTVVEHTAITPAPRGTGDLFSAVLLSARLGGATPEAALREAAAATLGVILASDAEVLALAEGQEAIAKPPLDLVRAVA